MLLVLTSSFDKKETEETAVFRQLYNWFVVCEQSHTLKLWFVRKCLQEFKHSFNSISWILVFIPIFILQFLTKC